MAPESRGSEERASPRHALPHFGFETVLRPRRAPRRGGARLSLFAALLLTFSLLSALPASAASGKYVITFDLSATQETITYSSTQPPPGYSGSYTETYYQPDAAYAYVQSADSDAVSAPNPGDSGSGDCSGQIVAHCVWTPDPSNPNEPPPLSVIVKKDCTAAWSVSPGDFIGATSSGSCSDGLGDPDNENPNGGGSSSGTHYEVKSGASFDVTCSPSAHMVCDATNVLNGTQGVGPEGSLIVSFRVTVDPVTITLGGTKLDSNGMSNILIGQLLTAGLSAPGTQCVTNYSWSLSANNAVTAYDITQIPTLFAWMPDQDASPSLYIYFTRPGQETLNCTASCLFPDGTHSPVSATKSILVWAPIFTNDVAHPGYTMWWLPTSGNWQGVSSIAYATAAFPNLGITFYGIVQEVPLFANTPGQWEFVQDITPGVSAAKLDGTTENCRGYGQMGLDADAPPSIGEPYQGIGDQGPFSVDGNQYRQSDMPFVSTYGWENIYINQLFHIYMFYRPSGDSGIWVPLSKLNWIWAGEAQLVSNLPIQWVATDNSTVGSWMPFPLLPQWDQVWYNQDGSTGW